jgi:hypothetical protein
MKKSLPVTTTEKYMKVIDLRKAGLTFEEIAERTGYESRSGAKMAFDAAVKYWGHESVTELRVIENERVEDLWRRTYQMLEDPTLTLPQSLRIMETALKVTESKRKLHGLDAPRQLEISGQDGDEIKTDVGTILKERLQELHDRYVESTVEPPTEPSGATADGQGTNTHETPQKALTEHSGASETPDIDPDPLEKPSEASDEPKVVNGIKILRSEL